MKKVSIVTPLYNEEKIVDELISRFQNSTKELNYEFEFVMVDDGSSDKTLMKLLSHKENESRLKIIKLSRNWGFQSAYNAGLDYAEGDAVVFIDGDLQDPPELIQLLLKKWEEGFNVVYSVKAERKESWIKQFLINIFYKLIKRFSNVDIDKQAGMFSLVDRRAADELRNCREKNKFYVGLRSFVGLRQAKVIYKRSERFAGAPRQSYRSLISYALNAFFSFSFLPIRLLTYLGIAILVFSTSTAFLLISLHFFKANFWLVNVDKLRLGTILLIIILGSIQIIFLGIIGEYIARIYDEVRNRPYYIVEKVY